MDDKQLPIDAVDCQRDYDVHFDEDAEVQSEIRSEVYDAPEAFNPAEMRKRKLNAAEAAEEAAQILARRSLARKFLLPFVMEFRVGYKAGWVHRDHLP